MPQKRNGKTWLGWTEKEDNLLRQLFSNGGNTSIDGTLKSFPLRTKQSIKKRMEKLGLRATTYMDWTTEEDEVLRRSYEESDSIHDLVPLLIGRDYNAIRSRANLLGLKRKILPVHNKNFFDVPNEINCSVAGFIAADGCISDMDRLTLRLSSKDRSHLIVIKDLLSFNGNVYDYKNNYDLHVTKKGRTNVYAGTQSTCSIQISCPEVSLKLKTHWNITPRKTFTLTPPNLVNNRLILAYISGLIDGDGWIVKDKDERASGEAVYSIAIMGTKELIEWVKNTFDRLVPNSNAAQLQPTESENIYDYKVSSFKSYWLAKLFLSLDIPRLDRKWDILREWVTLVENGDCLSERGLRALIDKKPSDDILTEFGLLESTKEILEKVTLENLAASS